MLDKLAAQQDPGNRAPLRGARLYHRPIGRCFTRFLVNQQIQPCSDGVKLEKYLGLIHDLDT